MPSAAHPTPMAMEDDMVKPVAVVGMACRFPDDATSPDAFYDMLSSGRSAWSEVPANRFKIDSYYHPSGERVGTTQARGAHWMKEDPALFDAPFSGSPIENLVGSETSVFVGSSSQEYGGILASDIDNINLYSAVGGGTTMLANRLSHFYDLRGASITLDTACSSGLVATHLGCQSIRSGESSLSLVAASQIMLLPDGPVALSRLQFLSPDSRCYTFDDRANGYARGEGICVMALKSLDDALRDNDTIRAVIRGSGTNQDGKTPGIVQPSSDAQAALMRTVYETSGLNHNDTTYFEAHGTGTKVGDPLELSALAKTLGTANRKPEDALYIGSVKTNIGHLEGCAGLAGLLKVILSIEKGTIVPSLNFKNPNPRIPFDEWRLRVPTKVVPWPTKGGVRRASINSFGYGGSNAHCIVDDAYNYLKVRGLRGNTSTVSTLVGTESPDEDTDSGLGTSMPPSPREGLADHTLSSSAETPKLFVLSSPEQAALQRISSQYIKYLEDKATTSPLTVQDTFNNLAYTLGLRRSRFQWRGAVVASSAIDLISTLQSPMKSFRTSQPPKLLYVFTGQGAQWHAMGRELFQYKTFRDTVEEADKYLKGIGADWSVIDELKASEEASRINQAAFSQPLCAVLQIALVDLLNHWGLEPTAVVGHSSGEIAAAYAAGALTASDCWKLAFHRGRLSQDITKIAPEIQGSMMSVGLSANEVRTHLDKLNDPEIVIACINSPSNVTLSGPTKSLEKVEAALKTTDVFVRKLKVNVAYHSPHMKIIADQYLSSIKDIQTLSPKSGPTFFSSVTGTPLALSELNASYWVRNMVSPVEFVKAFETIFPERTMATRRRRRNKVDVDTILEIGPHNALQGPIRQILMKNDRAKDADYVSALSRGKDAVVTSLQAVGHLWSKGQPLEFLKINSFEDLEEPQKCLTDLPRYPWNHTTRFWHESPGLDNHRFKWSPRLDLLGKPTTDFNPIEPRWRNIVRVYENPWLNDHKIQGSVLYPLASMLCAVLEAGQQMANQTEKVQGFELRDILVSEALVLPTGPEQGASTVLHMRPRKTGTKAQESFWYEFTFYSEQPERIVEHCSGLVHILYSSGKSSVEQMAAEVEDSKRLISEYTDLLQVCNRSEKPEEFYRARELLGIAWGPSFQGLTKINMSEDSTCFSIKIKDTRAVMPAQFEYDHLLHPTTLDACFQATFAPKIGCKEARIPTSIDYLYVSADMPKGAGTELCGFASISRVGFSNFTGGITVTDSSVSQTAIAIKGMKTTTLGSLNGEAATPREDWEIKKVCTELVWKEDLGLIRQKEADKIFTPKTLVSSANMSACREASTIYMTRLLEAQSGKGDSLQNPDVLQYLDWVSQQLNLTTGSKTTTVNNLNGRLVSPWTDEGERLARLSESSVDGRIVCDVGQNLLESLGSETSAVEKQSLLDDYYATAPSIMACNELITKWVDLSAHKVPYQRILEIGSGNGTLTYPALQATGGQNHTTPYFNQYVVSDSDGDHFPALKERLKAWEEHLQYKVLNIEKDPIDQGFEAGSFNLILAGHVFNSVKNVEAALNHCFQLLKPGGKLVIGEFTNPTSHMQFVLSAISTKADSQHSLTPGPIVDENEWQRRLLASNFNGTEIVVKDSQDPAAYCSSMVVTTKPAQPTLVFNEFILVSHAEASQDAQMLAQNVIKELEDLKVHVKTATLEQAVAEDANGKMLISGKAVLALLEVETPLVSIMSETEFTQLQKLLGGCLGGLWISRSNRQVDPTGDPAYSTSVGLLRTLRNEKPEIKMLELSLSSAVQISLPETATMIRRPLQHILEAGSIGQEPETETAEVDDVYFVPRLIDHKSKNRSLDTINHKPPPEKRHLSEVSYPLILDIGTSGRLDTLRFVRDLTPQNELDAHDVEVEVQANGVNYSDIMVSMGQVADTEIGLDAAGIIKRVGRNVTLVRPGDRVATFHPGAYRTLLRTHQSLVAKLPEEMSMEAAASLPTIYVTAYQALYVAARLLPGETVLIHSAAGGLGQAAIQIAQHIGAEIFVTVGSTAKEQLLISEYGIPIDHIFNSRDLSFDKGIMRMTKGRGVDVILNSLSGEALRRTWECTAMFGRFVEVGKRDILGNTGLEMNPFLRNITFIGINTEHMYRQNPTQMAEVLRGAFDLIRSKSVGLIRPMTVFNYSDIEKAFRTVQQGEHMGKLVLKRTPEDVVPVITENPHPLKLRENATYVLVGGLGGIGRYLAIQLAQSGAKHLASFSRSGDTKPEAQATLTELRGMGVNAKSYICDAGDPIAFEAAVARVSSEQPPIKGGIHGTMLLNDVFFETMTYKQWNQTIRNKVQGGLNMHNLFPKDLDFFVMLSSMSGIMGNPAQTNYASGNTFLDGLAHHRRNQGLAACTLNLGFIAGVGWAAENVKIADENKADWDLISLQPPEVWSLVESAITGYSYGNDPMPIQVATCTGSGGQGQQMKMQQTSIHFGDPKYSFLRQLDVRGENTGGAMSEANELRTKLAAVPTLPAAADIIEGALAAKLAKAMSMAPEDIDTSKPVSAFGVDSLIAMEIRNWVFGVLRSKVGIFDILRSGPILQLAAKIAENSLLINDEVKAEAQKDA